MGEGDFAGKDMGASADERGDGAGMMRSAKRTGDDGVFGDAVKGVKFGDLNLFSGGEWRK